VANREGIINPPTQDQLSDERWIDLATSCLAENECSQPITNNASTFEKVVKLPISPMSFHLNGANDYMDKMKEFQTALEGKNFFTSTTHGKPVLLVSVEPRVMKRMVHKIIARILSATSKTTQTKAFSSTRFMDIL